MNAKQLKIDEFRQAIMVVPENYTYFGSLDQAVWGRLYFCAAHRDSDALERSIFQVISKDLEERFPQAVVIERDNQFAVGWIDVIRLDTTNQDALKAAFEWYQRLEQYSVTNDGHYSQTERSKRRRRKHIASRCARHSLYQ